MRERALDQLVGLDQLAAPRAQVADLALELLSSFLEICKHALAQRARFSDDLLRARTRRVFGFARLRLDGLLCGGAQLARGLLRLAHHAAGMLLRFVLQLDRRFTRLTQHARRLLAQRGDEVLVRGWEHGLARLLLELTDPSGEVALPGHGRREVTRHHPQVGAHFRFGVAALHLAERALRDRLGSGTGTARCKDIRGVGHAVMIALRSSTVAALPRHPPGATRRGLR
jgi:hypothetical protein